MDQSAFSFDVNAEGAVSIIPVPASIVVWSTIVAVQIVPLPVEIGAAGAIG
jgi:hypothetical protein